MAVNPYRVEEMISVLEENFPKPADVFEQVTWNAELLACAKELVKKYTKELDYAVETAKESESDVWRLKQKQSVRYVVDLNKLRAEKPDVFYRVVKIGAYDAVKILSNEYIYELCREKLGDEGVKEYEKVNKTDLKSIADMSDSEIQSVCKIQLKPGEWVVERKI
ncbi:MAG TPA: hypothetical protein O0X70_05175 [Methanocorpusculum sp.]|nr:hypothetical protein [Methanocorpusculum sp.]